MTDQGLDGRPIELRSERFVLRTLTQEDATERYVAWLNDPEINAYLEVRFAESTVASVRDYIAWHDNVRKFLFGIFAEGEELHIGNFSLVTEPEHRRGTLGVIVGDKAYWGEKVVLETRAAILDFAFGRLGLEKVHGGCYANNRPAIYNYRRQGWTADGIRKRHVLCDGQFVDVVHFAMFRNEWIGRHER